jgi:hypothetical protein
MTIRRCRRVLEGRLIKTAKVGITMAETTKLSVEKALEKLRAGDAPKTKNAQRDEKMDALDEEIKRMRAQRLRLDRKRQKGE